MSNRSKFQVKGKLAAMKIYQNLCFNLKDLERGAGYEDKIKILDADFHDER